MGYYTYYTMEIFDLSGNDVTDKISDESDLSDIIEYPEDYDDYVVNAIRSLSEADNYWFYGLLSEEASKWYEHEEEMIELSKEHPKLVFKLHGEGEEQGDVWIKYFHNGRMETLRPELQWPIFDVEKFVRG